MFTSDCVMFGFIRPYVCIHESNVATVHLGKMYLKWFFAYYYYYYFMNLLMWFCLKLQQSSGMLIYTGSSIGNGGSGAVFLEVLPPK